MDVVVIIIGHMQEEMEKYENPKHPEYQTSHSAYLNEASVDISFSETVM